MKFSDVWRFKFFVLQMFWFLVKGNESNCPSGVPNTELFTYKDTCYHFRDNSAYRVSYESAESDCKSRSGLLLTMENNQTATAVSELLYNHVDSHTILLGLRKVAGTWAWVTGTTMKFNKFDTSQRATSSDTCAKLKLMEGVWEKSPCGSTDWFSIYVCEHNKKSIEVTGGGQRTGSSIGVVFSLLVSLAVLFGLH